MQVLVIFLSLALKKLEIRGEVHCWDYSFRATYIFAFQPGFWREPSCIPRRPGFPWLIPLGFLPVAAAEPFLPGLSSCFSVMFPRVLLTSPHAPCSHWVIPSSLIILIITRGMLMCPTLSSLTVPLNPTELAAKNIPVDCHGHSGSRCPSWIFDLHPSSHHSFYHQHPKETLWFVLDFYLCLHPSSMQSPHLINQNGPADLLPEYSCTVFGLHHHYYYCINFTHYQLDSSVSFFWEEGIDF